jgi:hypothetical protein
MPQLPRTPPIMALTACSALIHETYPASRMDEVHRIGSLSLVNVIRPEAAWADRDPKCGRAGEYQDCNSVTTDSMSVSKAVRLVVSAFTEITSNPLYQMQLPTPEGNAFCTFTEHRNVFP